MYGKRMCLHIQLVQINIQCTVNVKSSKIQSCFEDDNSYSLIPEIALGANELSHPSLADLFVFWGKICLEGGKNDWNTCKTSVHSLGMLSTSVFLSVCTGLYICGMSVDKNVPVCETNHGALLLTLFRENVPPWPPPPSVWKTIEC